MRSADQGNLTTPAVQTEPVQALLQVQRLVLAYSGSPVVCELSLTLAKGEIACLLGPSGCGKSTLLRAIAGLHNVHSGSISLRGELLSSTKRQVPPDARRLSFVFQDLALFPHLCVADNLALGILRRPAPARAARIAELLEQFELTAFAKRFPHELSGGQQQRVALARALAPQHDLILLDEPFSSLDARLRTDLSRSLRQQLTASGTSAILVSHDLSEALACADVIGVMNKGRLEQWGTPFSVYCQPASLFVAGFVGDGTMLNASVRDGQIKTLLGAMTDPKARTAHAQMRLLLRPEDLHFDASAALRGRVLRSEFRGAQTLYQIQTQGLELLVSAAHSQPLPDGMEVGLRVAPRHINLF